MTRLSIDALLANTPVEPREHLNPERVADYVQAREPLPPVVVYQTDEGLLLADGYHRIAAAQQRGSATVEAEIRRHSPGRTSLCSCQGRRSARHHNRRRHHPHQAPQRRLLGSTAVVRWLSKPSPPSRLSDAI